MAIACGVAAWRTEDDRPADDSPPLPQVTIPHAELRSRPADVVAARVENIGGSAARNVRVSPFTVGMYTIEFEPIQLIAAGAHAPLKVKRGSVGELPPNVELLKFMALFDLPEEGWLHFIVKDHPGAVTAPLTIRFTDRSDVEHTVIQQLHVTEDEVATIRALPRRVRR